MLGFMTTPVLPPEVVPPSFARTMLRLRTPPMLDTIAAHLAALGASAADGGGTAALARWPPTAGDPTAAVGAALAALTPSLDNLEPGGLQALSKVGCCKLTPLLKAPGFSALDLNTVNCFQVVFQCELAPLQQGGVRAGGGRRGDGGAVAVRPGSLPRNPKP